MRAGAAPPPAEGWPPPLVVAGGGGVPPPRGCGVGGGVVLGKRSKENYTSVTLTRVSDIDWHL